MYTRILPLALCTLFVLPATAQQEVDLPQGLAPHELELIPAYRDSRAGASRGITTPPDFPVRTMAEWEEVQSLAITWRSYPPILKQIVANAKTECEVIVFCTSTGSGSPANVSNYLLSNNEGGPALPDLDNVVLQVAPSNSIWIRDFGPE
ncbi:MAG: hypothetical protein WEC15_03695, partial [Flavobacteriales bacterium]